MRPEEQRIAIAEACGWKRLDISSYGPLPYWDDPSGVYVGGGSWTPIPDYLNSLDAMHEAITQHGNGPQWMEFRSEFTRNLLEVVRRGPNYLDGTASWYFATATPMQLAEAFLKTLNLWKA